MADLAPTLAKDIRALADPRSHADVPLTAIFQRLEPVGSGGGWRPPGGLGSFAA